MSGRRRRGAMAILVAVVMLWPLAHLGLVARYRIDAWEFFGWAMYSLPAARVQVRVDVERGGETKQWRVMGESRRRLQDFARRRTALGLLASPTTLADSIFAEDPRVDALAVIQREIQLDRRSGLLTAHDHVSRFERSGAPD